MMSSFISAFLLGLFSAVHCIAMCGPVIGALTLSVPREIRESGRQMFPFVLNYNIGRILSYAMAGAIVGLLGSPLLELNAHRVLRVLSVIVMIGMGLWLAGWFPKFAQVERLGTPVWRCLQPIGQKLLPVRRKSHSFLLGIVWGWLPCGMVYGALVLAALSGSMIEGGLVMLAFGAGTLPAVLSAGMFTGALISLAKNPLLKKVAGVSIIMMALVTTLMAMQDMTHHGQHTSSQKQTSQSTRPDADHMH